MRKTKTSPIWKSRDDLPPVVTASEVADFMRVCDRTVYALISAGQLRASRLGNNTWRITREALDEFLDGDTSTATISGCGSTSGRGERDGLG